MIVDWVADFQARVRESGVSMLAICMEAGINPATERRWRTGVTEPRMATIRAMEKALAQLTSKEDENGR